jgi:beta-lactamase regulating signal transducer with metallopeptidase domain
MTWPAEIGWLSLFAEYLIKSTFALTLALILIVLFRKRSASLRHFVLSLSLAGLLLLPVLPYFGIGWETALLPARPSAASVILAVPADKVPIGGTSGAQEHRSDIFTLPGSFNTPEMLAHSEQLQSASGPIFKIAIPFIWSAGLIILLLRLAAGLFGAFRLTREGEAVRDPRWRVLLERFLATIHLQRKVRLKSHRDVLIPLTWGFIKPVVLIPASHATWTEDQRSSALIHELSHVKRADFLVMVLVRLSLAMFWFNPLSWVVFRRLKNEQEEACDELVLRSGIKPSTYAADLLFFKSTAGAHLSHFAALLGLFAFGRSAFNERLTAILRQKWTFQEVKMKTKIMLCCAIILAVALIGLARPSTPGEKEAEMVEGSIGAPGPDILDKTASPASPEIRAVDQSQEQGQAEEKKAPEKKQQEQAQAQEKQQKKEEKKPAVLVTVKEGEKHRHVITIKEGDKVKTITVDKPIIIKEGAEGKVILITSEGKEVTVLEGEPAHLEIKADKLEFIKEGKILKVSKEGGVVYIIGEPDIDIGKAVEVALEEVPVAVKVAEPMTPHITLEPGVKIAEPARFHITRVARDEERLIREKLRDIREKLKEVEEKKLELQEVDEALADLEKELEKMSRETSRVAIKHMEKPEVFTIVEKKGDEEKAADIGVDIAEHAHKDSIKVVVKEKGSFLLYYQANAGEKGREAYEKIVARVKKDLPAGFTLEPEFEEGSGLITLKVNGPFEKGAPHDLVQKLADSIRDEAKDKKE